MRIFSTEKVEGKIWVLLGGYPSSCSQNITLYCPIRIYVIYVGTYLGYSPKGTQLFPLIPIVWTGPDVLNYSGIHPVIQGFVNPNLFFFKVKGLFFFAKSQNEE